MDLQYWRGRKRPRLDSNYRLDQLGFVQGSPEWHLWEALQASRDEHLKAWVAANQIQLVFQPGDHVTGWTEHWTGVGYERVRFDGVIDGIIKGQLPETGRYFVCSPQLVCKGMGDAILEECPLTVAISVPAEDVRLAACLE